MQQLPCDENFCSPACAFDVRKFDVWSFTAHTRFLKCIKSSSFDYKQHHIYDNNNKLATIIIMRLTYPIQRHNVVVILANIFAEGVLQILATFWRLSPPLCQISWILVKRFAPVEWKKTKNWAAVHLIPAVPARNTVWYYLEGVVSKTWYITMQWCFSRDDSTFQFQAVDGTKRLWEHLQFSWISNNNGVTGRSRPPTTQYRQWWR